MSSKIEKVNVWEGQSIDLFLSQLGTEHSLYAIKTFDSYIERNLLKRSESFRPYDVINGKELKEAWLTENAMNFDLFSGVGDSLNYVIIESESLTSDVEEFFLQYYPQLTKKFFFLFLKKTKFMEKIAKLEECSALVIEPPKFWDYSKYFLFCLDQEGCQYEAKLKKVSLEGKDMGTAEIAEFAAKMALESKGKKLTFDHVKAALDLKVQDRFYIADQLVAKNYKAFTDELVKLSYNADELRSVVTFLQSHFLKIKYPSYLPSNKKPSGYDKKIQQANRNWRVAEIDQVLDFLSDVETVSKVDTKNVTGYVKTKKGELLNSPSI